MALLYYWRGDNYRRDLDDGAGYQLNQGNPLLHEIPVGDSLWAFTRRRDGVYALAAELVVTAKTHNPPGYHYGRYRVWGDLTASRYFATEYQADITPLVRSLSLTANGNTLGGAFQGHAAVRRISAEDDRVLRAFAVGLELDPRAKLVPEERLEGLLLAGDSRSVEALIRDESSGISERRAHYLMTEAVARNRQFVDSLRETYLGRCQICTWAPRSIYRTDLCEAHHVRWLGRGGDDRLSNMVLLCPNHHRAVHRLDAPFDWDALSFAFAEKSEPLKLLKHDLEAS